MILGGVKLGVESCMMLDGVGVLPLICFGNAVAVVDDTTIDERSYMDKTVTLSAICSV